MKGTWKKKNRNNPFSRGNFLSNCSQILCGPIPPSQIKASQPATREQYDVYQRNCQTQNKKSDYRYPTTNREDNPHLGPTNGYRDPSYRRDVEVQYSNGKMSRQQPV
jgi:hypothetical protein